jgi:hypothetical protein
VYPLDFARTRSVHKTMVVGVVWSLLTGWLPGDFFLNSVTLLIFPGPVVVWKIVITLHEDSLE